MESDTNKPTESKDDLQDHIQAESPAVDYSLNDNYIEDKEKNDDNKLVKEFELMISQDDRLREFAEKSMPQTEPAAGGKNNNATEANLESIIDTRILDMLRMLEEYRRKCIKEDDDYIEARRAESKFEKTLSKATKKQRTQIYNFQEKELKNIEITQKQQYQEFWEAWDEYMADYEATAYLSLEKLKERHMKEYQEFQNKCQTEFKGRFKYSKEVYELKHKYEKLICLQKYEEAEKTEELFKKLEEKENK